MSPDDHKIVDALKDARRRGKRLKSRPAPLSDDAAWLAIESVIDRFNHHPGAGRNVGRGKPIGSPLDYLVAMLAPIYRRYTGAAATVSNSHPVKKKAALHSFPGDDRQKKTHVEDYKTTGPFPRFVLAVAAACDPRVPPLKISAEAIRKAIKRLAGESKSARAFIGYVSWDNEWVDDSQEGEPVFDGPSEARWQSQAQFQGVYETAGEVFKDFIKQNEDQ